MSHPPSDEALETLMAMGFERDSASTALLVTDGNLEAAANYLLGGGGGGGGGSGFYDDPLGGGGGAAGGLVTSPTPRTDNTISSVLQNNAVMVHAPTSQYSFEDGRSACTCLALQMASSFLREQDQVQNAASAASIITSEWIQTNIQQGVEVYRNIMRHQQSSASESISTYSDTEHLSAEQAYKQFTNLRSVDNGTIRQGILSHDPSHPQGLHQLLYDCLPSSTSSSQQSSSSSSPLTTGWVCVVVTKTPETVLLCLPPADLQHPRQQQNTTDDDQSFENQFVLLDTHPRPQLHPIQAQQAYGRFHRTMDDLVASCERIFPIVDLGMDVPELMAAMYNSFDLYVFRYNPK